MKITEISKGITQLSVNIKDILFESLWEMPNGVTINSYVVKGEKTALVDGVCGWDGVPESLFKLLDEIDVDIKSIEYLVLNHLEPDHAGWIEDLLKVHQDFQVICTDKGADIFEAFFDTDVKVHRVKDGDVIDLGDGKVLSFTTIPHVHWPDAMVSYERSSQVLFTCDAFGSFGIFEKSTVDDAYTDAEILSYERDTIRYYSNIIAAFSPFVLKAIEKLENLEIFAIAPGHGLVWKSRAKKILEDYKTYALYQKGSARKEITLIWGSMYGMTAEAVQFVEKRLKASGIKYHIHQVPETSWGEVLTSVWTSSAVILGMPTYEYKMFPPMSAVLEELGKKKVQGRKAFRFGSYGWSGGAQKELEEINDRLKLNWTFIESYEFKGKARDEDLKIIEGRVTELIDML
ncbi:FprA family A-type flavoprotein [Fusibacter tunisiensis]|uniref:Flavorubredoxin n=1 Tax=Fusibacter tunisiensis TaxID=1008308 RepID=A0ABS2MTT5_9FIRM|nr:FprA family A-type flavoprotein [Fusibacter tunisiensis]MBM7562839.1 flavorubredoxin [Fusibacter tunisiensis]